MRPGLPDDRVLPTSASAHQAGEQLRRDFTDNAATAVPIVIPDAAGMSPKELTRYAIELSRVPDVSSVSASTGVFAGGRAVAPPAAPPGRTGTPP